MTDNNENKVLNVPHLRFPKFSGEWEICKVSELLDFYSTNSLSWEQLEYGEKAMMNLHYGLIHVGLPTMVDLRRDKLPNVKEGNMPKNFELCKEGDVAFADASEDTNEVAKVIELFNLDNKDIVCGLHTIHGRDNKNKTIVGFKGYAFSSSAFHNQIRRIAQGTKIYSISTKNFSECYVGIPSKAEQTKIATLLRLIDERIATQNKIIEDLKKLKSAISHILFSSKGAIHLSEIANVVMGQSPSSNAYNDQGLGMPLVQGNLDISNGKTTPRLYTAEFNQTTEKGNIILTVRAPVGEVAKATQKVCLGRGVCAIIPHEENMSDFIYQYLTFYKFMWRRYEQGSTFTSINGSDVRNIFCPKVRNVSILTLLDIKINIEERVVKQYQSQKQYMLYQMFI